MIPKISSELVTWPQLQNVLLADPHYAKPGSIDIILGAELYEHFLEGSIIKGASNAPIAQASKLGWVISGLTHYHSVNVDSQTYHCSVTHDLHELLEQFWHQTEIGGSEKKTLSTTEQDCENHFASTHSQNAAVRLPFKLPPAHLGDSKPSGIRILNHLQ